MIPQSATSLPVSTQELLVNLDKLVNSLPKNDLKTVVKELGNAFRDTGPALGRLLDASNSLVTTATDEAAADHRPASTTAAPCSTPRTT